MMCCSQYKKSTLKANALSQTVAANGVIQMSPIKITGCSLASDGSISITKPGLYQVIFNATTTPSVASENISVQLYRNNVADPVGIAVRNPSDLTDIQSFGFSSIVEVTKSNCPCNGLASIPLTFVNTGAAATYNNIALTVVKLA